MIKWGAALRPVFLTEKFPNCTSETIKARPFQRIEKKFCAQEMA
jgi:hypothetical protein